MHVSSQLIRVFLVICVGLNLTTKVGANVRMRASSELTAGRSEDCYQLVIASPIEHDLQPGDQHCYQVYAEAGQYFRVVLLQKGIDVGVRVKDPEGREIVDVDSPN